MVSEKSRIFALTNERSVIMEMFTIQSDVALLSKVEDFVAQFCGEKNVHNYFATISMSVLHAVENAIVHGNQCDSSKQVAISCGNCMGGLYFEVRDEGCGFDYRQYSEMPMDGDRGVGLFMMRCLADRVVYSDGGSTVRLEYLIAGIDKAMATERCAVLKRFYAKEKVGV